MATRDTSKKIGFMYENMYKAYKTNNIPKEVPKMVIVSPFVSLKRDLDKLTNLHKQLKDMIDQLENLVKE